MEETYSYKQFTIVDVKDLYKHKQQIYGFGLRFDSVKRFYRNKFEISQYQEAELKEFCDALNLELQEKLITKKDFKGRLTSMYELEMFDNETFYIKNRKTNKILYCINVYHQMETDIINFVDFSRGEYFNHRRKLNHERSVILQILELLYEIEDNIISDGKFSNIIEFTQIIAILSGEQTGDGATLSKEVTLKKFKYSVIGSLNQKGNPLFLCNGVDQFYAETKFYIRGNKILSSFENMNTLPYKQEMKVWEWLYRNRNYIGVERELTYVEQFLGKKILVYVKNTNDIEKVIISKVFPNNENPKLIDVYIKTGEGEKKLPMSYTREKLQKWLEKARV